MMKFYLLMMFTLGLTDSITQAASNLLNFQNAITVDPTENIVSVAMKNANNELSAFNFAGTNYDTLYFSVDGVASFENNLAVLEHLDFMAEHYIAPLAFHQTTVWFQYKQYSTPDSGLNDISNIVNEYDNTNFVASDLTAVQWDSQFDAGNIFQFQVALTQNSDKTKSYVVFVYNLIGVTPDATVGISLGEDQSTVLAWSGSSHRPSCEPNISVQDFTGRSQTACGTRAGVLVFPVHDADSFSKRDVCTFVPKPDCVPPQDPPAAQAKDKYRVCKARANIRR